MKLRELSVIRQTDATQINAVANHRDILPFVAGVADAIDLGEALSNRDNVLLMADETGGQFYIKSEPGVYEVHTLFLPEARGKHVIDVVTDAVHYMFTRTDCVEIVTRVPDGNVAAAALTRRFGGNFLFHMSNAWPSPSGNVGAGFYMHGYRDWIRRASYLSVTGHDFHDQLETAKIASGSDLPIHDDDDCHDRYVGAACEMIAAGQPDKGVAVYNQWARLAGYQEISIVSRNPTVIDIHDALIAARGDSMEVLLCR